MASYFAKGAVMTGKACSVPTLFPAVQLAVCFGLLLSLGPSFARDQSAILDVTVAEVLKNPWAFHGQNIQITGTFNECVSYTCALCDSPVPTDPGSEQNEGKCLGVSFIHKHLETLARFSTVTVQGRYDAVCSGVPEDPSAETIMICTDRASQLENASIMSVQTARSALDGYISVYGAETLTPISEAEEIELVRAFLAAMPSFMDVEVEQVYAAYIFDQSDVDLEAGEFGFYPIGGVCVCHSATDMCRKPALEGHTYFQAAVKDYICYSAEKRGGSWRFWPGE